MKRAMTIGVAVATAIVASAAAVAARAADDPLKDARQLLLVVTDGWNAVNGSLQRFERESPNAPWRPASGRVAVVVGKNGLAWGRGLAAVPGEGPVKREGDGKAPAGVFALSTAFGQSPEKPAGWKMPYRPLGDNVECVDDAKSAVYNRLTTKGASAGAVWTSSEKMWQEPLYKWGVVVDHNLPTPLAGGGSCIFLHIWRGPDHGTAGCTAMEESSLTAAIGWLAPAANPRLVQLPRAEYERLKGQWKLPPDRLN